MFIGEIIWIEIQVVGSFLVSCVVVKLGV